MKIRPAEKKDIGRILVLLGQVLEVHAAIRPDIFIPGSTKYGPSEIEAMLGDESRPVYVAVDSRDTVIGYAFCSIKARNNIVRQSVMFIDDFCVDEKARGKHIGTALFEHMKAEASRLGCYEVALNVWAGNEKAEQFYEKMGMKTKSRILEYIL